MQSTIALERQEISITEAAPAFPALHRRDRHPEGAHGRGRLEHPRPRACRARPTRRQPLAQPRRVPARAARRSWRSSTRKWQRELDYRLIKELWAFSDNRIAVRFAYEWHDDCGNWFRSYGNENWEFDAARADAARHRQHQRPADRREPSASTTGRWAAGPTITRGLSDLGL